MHLARGFAAAAICLVLVADARGDRDGSGGRTFELQEVSVFDAPGGLHPLLASGQSVLCTQSPDPNVHCYPSFVSQAVLYGTIEMPRGFLVPERGQVHAFALDESAGAGTGHDRLYFDLDCDGDLTDDPPLAKLPAPPEGAVLKDDSIRHQTCFESVRVPLLYGEQGTRAMEIMPRLTVDEQGKTRLAFVTTTARRGRVDIAGRTYEAWLGHSRCVAGWFDRPSTALCLIVDGNYDVPKGWMAYQLCTLRRIGETYYSFSATPAGDRLTARPYTGELGTFQVQPAGHNVRSARVSGMLASDRVIVAVGGPPVEPYGSPRPASHCRVPVGDYWGCLDIWLDDLYANVMPTTHADGGLRARLRASHGRGIQIRADKPFVFDFSNRPQVLFVSPSVGERISVGGELPVYAVLTDPVLDLMFIDIARVRRDYLSSEVFWHRDYRLARPAVAAGILVSIFLWGVSVVFRSKRRGIIRVACATTILATAGALAFALSLRERSFAEAEHDSVSPLVTIARSNGEVVAQGSMPFY